MAVHRRSRGHAWQPEKLHLTSSDTCTSSPATSLTSFPDIFHQQYGDFHLLSILSEEGTSSVANFMDTATSPLAESASHARLLHSSGLQSSLSNMNFFNFAPQRSRTHFARRTIWPKFAGIFNLTLWIRGLEVGRSRCVRQATASPHS